MTEFAISRPIWNESELRSDEHYMSSSENKTWKKKKRIQAFTGFEPMTSVIPAQCSANRADMPIRAGHYFGSKKRLNLWKNDCEYTKTKYVNCEWSWEWKRSSQQCTADHKSVENNLPN